MSLARAKPRAIRIAVRCDTVVVLTVGHGTTVLQYNESWVYDGTAYVKIPATLHKVSEDGAELSVSGMKFLLSEWRGKLRNKDTGREIHVPSNGHVAEQEVLMSGVGCYRCKLADPKPFPHLYVNYPDFYLKLDGYRTPFKGEKWKVFTCKGEKVDEEWFLLRALENSPPLDHSLQGCSIKIRLEDFQELKEHARELQAHGRVTPPPPGIPIDVSPPATPGRNSPVVPILSDTASSISSELGHHLRGLSQGNLSQLSDHDLPSGLSDGRITGLTFSMSRESAASLGESSVGGGSSESGDYTPRERLGFVRRVNSRAASSPGSVGSLSPQERLELEVSAFVQQLDGEFNLGERSGTWWRALFTKLGQHPLAASAMQDVLVGQGSPSSIY